MERSTIKSTADYFKNDILFSTVRTYMKNIAVVEDKIYNGQIASSGFCVLRSNNNFVDSKFIFIILYHRNSFSH